MPQKWLRALALLSSGTLVIIFLMYRTGELDRYLFPEPEWQTSPNGGPIGNKINRDTTILPKKDSVPVHLYSSKSMIVVDKLPKQPKFPDSLFKPKKPVDSSLAPTQTPMIPGTKSAIIIDPKRFKQKRKDSTKKNRWE